MSEFPVRTQIDDNGLGWIIMDRPEVHNAFDDHLIAVLTDAFRIMGEDLQVRVIMLAAEGKNFSAGADLNWMKRMAGYSQEENLADARKLAALFSTIDRSPKPVIALVNGAAFGGGVGLVCACDMAIASANSSFSLSEVKLGIIPSVISPYVVAAMGQRQARRYLLTAERFKADEALRIGVVHQIVEPEALRSAGQELAGHLLNNGPSAIAACKELIGFVARGAINDDMVEGTAQRIARVRATDEGKEGLSAFLEKRPPNWIKS